jgi:hypothetical protein
MKSWKIIAIIATVAVVAASLLAASAFAMANGQVFPGMHRTNTPSTYGYGMMGGYGYYPQTTVPTRPNAAIPYHEGRGCGNHGLIGSTYANNGTTLSPISINTAVTDAQNYLATLNNPDLAVKQVEEYSNNFYVQVTEKSTGNGALELIVDKYTGSIYPEMGPNMMWNTKYGIITAGTEGTTYGYGGMMGAGGMMSGYSNTVTPTTTLPVNVAQAKADAEQYLNANYPGTTDDITTFYGYYTIEVLNGTTTQGMLSVNGYTGQVWYHTWHGTFIQELNVS